MRKTIVELDLAGYSTIARELEESLSANVVLDFNTHLQSFVDAGLASVRRSRTEVVAATTGDGAILVFDTADEAHHFARAVHEAARTHNSGKTVPSARRAFRIGGATGDIAIKPEATGRLIAGVTIANAVRLEAAAAVGEFLVDVATFDDLSPEIQHLYGSVEQIRGKRDELFWVRRCRMISDSGGTGTAISPDAIYGLFDQLNPRDQLQRLMTMIQMPKGHQPSNALSIAQRQDVIMDWAASSNQLLNRLAEILNSLLKKQLPPR